jgi:hypothetical protein
MDLAIEELKRSQKYHLRQHEENLQTIRRNEESNELIKVANKKHEQIIEEINLLIETVKKDS